MLSRILETAPIFKITLPLPPSVNACYSNAGKSRVASPALARWRGIARKQLFGKRYDLIDQPIAVKYSMAFPDKRKRDVANFEKAVSDFLVHLGIIKDDSLIQCNVQIKLPVKGSYIICEIYSLE